MLITILGYVFLGIFVLTALLTLLSLPNWIEIPEEYRKTLFRALLLEVIGAIIILFSNHYLNGERVGNNFSYQLNNEDWVALSLDNANIIQPKLKFTGQDTTIEVTIGKNKFSGNFKFNLLSSNEGIQIQNGNQDILGQISNNSLLQAGFFNSISSNQGEISSSNNYGVLKFTKGSDGKWKRKGNFLKNSPFRIELFDRNSETNYRIVKGPAAPREEMFNSESSSKSLFHLDNRMIHFYENQGQYYLFRIAEADLQKRDSRQYVSFLQIRLVPDIKM